VDYFETLALVVGNARRMVRKRRTIVLRHEILPNRLGEWRVSTAQDDGNCRHVGRGGELWSCLRNVRCYRARAELVWKVL
jgi:hypothetical protein